MKRISLLRSVSLLFASVAGVLNEERKLMREERVAPRDRPAQPSTARSVVPSASPPLATAPSASEPVNPALAAIQAELDGLGKTLDEAHVDMEKPIDMSLGGPPPTLPPPTAAEPTPAAAATPKFDDPMVQELADVLAPDAELDGPSPAGTMEPIRMTTEARAERTAQRIARKTEADAAKSKPEGVAPPPEGSLDAPNMTTITAKPAVAVESPGPRAPLRVTTSLLSTPKPEETITEVSKSVSALETKQEITLEPGAK